MSCEKPLRLSPNAYFFHGDLWTEDELRQRWHITPEGEAADSRESAAEHTTAIR